MVKRLESMGLVKRELYRGVELTTTGERVALEVIRHHRLLELYLAEALDMSWDRVHEEAEVLEHAISPELSELIARKLGNPTHDPHGDPIPTASGEIEPGRSRPLSELEPGDRGTFVRVSDADPEALRYLSLAGHRAGRPLRGARAPAVRGAAGGALRLGRPRPGRGAGGDDARGRGRLILSL